MGIEDMSSLPQVSVPCGRFRARKKRPELKCSGRFFYAGIVRFKKLSRGDPCDRPFYGLSHQHHSAHFDEVSRERIDAAGGLPPSFDRSWSTL